MSKAVDRAVQRFNDLVTFKMPLAEKQAMARSIRAESGIEFTPDQVERTLAKALATIRRKMIDSGHPEFGDMTIFEVRDVVRAMGDQLP